jgi:hypothetical protein
MGLDMNAQGGLTVVSDAYMFDYQLIPKPGCIKSGGWVATYGAEDARLFWTVSVEFGPECPSDIRMLAPPA